MATKEQPPETPRDSGALAGRSQISEGPSAEVRLADLERAIARVTRLLGAADDDATAADLVAARRDMRTDLGALKQTLAGNVVPFDKNRRR